MRRILTIPLLFIYIIAVSGVMIQLHYCGQELESWNVYAQNDGCADDGCGDESEENDGCCKDEVVVAKVVNDQDVVSPQAFKFISGQDALPAYHVHCIECVDAYGIATLQYSPNAPPGSWQNIPLYKLHSNLTYYG